MDSCKCVKCRAACARLPGWFKPEEIDKLADFLNLSIKECFDKHLQVDYWLDDDDHGTIFVLRPATVNTLTGCEAPFVPFGWCSFFKNDLCEIHEVKPYECSVSFFCRPAGTLSDSHHKVALCWLPYQTMIEELLGIKPTIPDVSFTDSILMGILQ